MFLRIFDGLDAMDVHGPGAFEAARLGFLEWVITLDVATDAREAARAALVDLPDEAGASPAARAFLSYLGQAAESSVQPPRRKGGRRRILH